MSYFIDTRLAYLGCVNVCSVVLKKYNYSLIKAPFNQYLRVLNMLIFFFRFLCSSVTYDSNMIRISVELLVILFIT